MRDVTLSSNRRPSETERKTLSTAIRDAENSLPRELVWESEHLNAFAVNKTLEGIRDPSSDVRQQELSRKESLGRPLTSRPSGLFHLITLQETTTIIIRRRTLQDWTFCSGHLPGFLTRFRL